MYLQPEISNSTFVQEPAEWFLENRLRQKYSSVLNAFQYLVPTDSYNVPVLSLPLHTQSINLGRKKQNSTYPGTSIIRHIFHIISQPPQKISDECSTLNSRHYKPLSVPDALRLYKAFGINTEQRQSGKHCVYHSPYYRHIPIAITSFGTGAPPRIPTV